MKLAVVLLASAAFGQPAQSDPAKAVTALQQAIRQHPEVESNYTDLGNILLRTQNFAEAAVVLEATRKKFPDSAQAALSLGVAYYGQRRFQDAVVAFLDANRLSPDVEQPVIFLSRILEHAGPNEEEVIRRFHQFAKAHPESPLGHFLVGKATRDESSLRRAIALNPNFADAHFELGAILEERKDLKSAIAEFNQAARLAPRNPIIRYRLFRLYTKTGDAAKAEAERALHQKLSEEENARLDKQQAATRHMEMKVQ